ncbi:hypothetical protein DTL42_03715 [Bremerella cremea]|uniref:Uncharacterized protein n=1 Tax=Bremerella cremea TaxID=1031537 RepID=A0A368KV05_9BACT|nr:hypothetical protein [Bremerella cremea]RCS54263.1 hypothetical protein DTL42_03715 [Bremerella cremea]
MTGTTNPYQTWLGLNVSSRPDCYTLLSLPLYEADAGKIMVAAQNAIARASIPMAPADEPARQALVSEIQLAQNCLLDPAQKQAYDQQLQAYFSGQTAPAQPVQTPAAPVATIQAVAAAPAASSDSSAEPLIQTKKQSTASSVKRRASNSAFTTYASIALVLLTLLGGGGYYFFFMQPAGDVAQQDPEDKPKPSPAEPAQPAEAPEEEVAPAKPNPKVPGGKRPTSEELANSIPSLGNPAETMVGMDSMPAMPSKPAEPTATAEQQADLQTALMTAWQGIIQNDFAKASVALNSVRELPKTNEGTTHFQQVDQFVQDLMAYNQALNEGQTSIQEGEELTVGSTSFTVTMVDDKRVGIRFANKTKAFLREELPDGLQRALAISRLKGDDGAKQRIEASHLLLSPKANIEYVRDLWVKSGADGGTLAALEADKKKYAAVETVAAASPANMPGEAMTDTPETEASPQTLKLAVEAARKQLTDRNAMGAKQALVSVNSLSLSPSNQAKLAALKQVADLNLKFWQAVSRQLTKLPPDEDLDVNGKLTRVVESDANRLVLRVAGENKRYTLDDMPSGLAKFLAEKELPANIESKKIIGAFLLVTPEAGVERAKEEWANGFLPQEEVDLLASALTASFEQEEAPAQPVAIPDDAALAYASEQVMKEWNNRIAAAPNRSVHSRLGDQLLEEANSQAPGSPVQYVTFRLALAEAARAVDFPLCTSIIDAWHAQFAIREGEWHAKAMQLAANSSDGDEVHTAIVQHAIKQIPLIRAKGEDELANAMLKLAKNFASKTNDQALIEALKQVSAAN